MKKNFLLLKPAAFLPCDCLLVLQVLKPKKVFQISKIILLVLSNFTVTFHKSSKDDLKQNTKNLSGYEILNIL